MADGHKTRLLRLKTCPVPECGCTHAMFLSDPASNTLDVVFICGARFRATDDRPIVAVAACRTRTDTAASLLNLECKEAAA